MVGVSTLSIMSAKHCSVPLCVSNRKRSPPDISFHMFPKDKDLRTEWIHKIRRHEGSIFKVMCATGFVCSKHFKKEDFAWNAGASRKRLKRGIVPSRFPWSVDGDSTSEKKHPAEIKMPVKISCSAQRAPMVDERFSTTTNDKTSLNNASNNNGSSQLLILKERVLKLHTKLKRTELDLSRKNTECELLKQQLSVDRFGLNRFCGSDSLVEFYTGFPTYGQFFAFFDCVKPCAESITSAYFALSDSVHVSEKLSNLPLFDELFLFMCRLRAGLNEEDLADRFSMQVSSVNGIIVTWCNLLYLVLVAVPTWPRHELVTSSVLPSFKELYPKTRVILDWTEVRVQTPEPLSQGSRLNSKNHDTFKGLVGLTPNGAVTFVSQLYPGSISDAEVIKESGFLELLEQGDDVMAVADFTISELVGAKHATLTTPPFFRNSRNGQRTAKDVYTNTQENAQIACVRTQVEAAIGRVKEHHLFDGVIPQYLSGYMNHLWTVSCLLCNFREPLSFTNMNRE